MYAKNYFNYFRYDDALSYIKAFLHFKDTDCNIYGWNNIMLGAFFNIFQWQQQTVRILPHAASRTRINEQLYYVFYTHTYNTLNNIIRRIYIGLHEFSITGCVPKYRVTQDTTNLL